MNPRVKSDPLEEADQTRIWALKTDEDVAWHSLVAQEEYPRPLNEMEIARSTPEAVAQEMYRIKKTYGIDEIPLHIEVESPPKCKCDRHQVVHFGCKCGGV